MTLTSISLTSLELRICVARNESITDAALLPFEWILRATMDKQRTKIYFVFTIIFDLNDSHWKKLQIELVQWFGRDLIECVAAK